MKSHPAFDVMDEFFRANAFAPQAASAAAAPSAPAEGDAQAQEQIAQEQAVNEVALDSALVRMLLEAMKGKRDAS
jgi:hypothetical protein